MSAGSLLRSAAAALAAFAALAAVLPACAKPGLLEPELPKSMSTGEAFGDSSCEGTHPHDEPDLMAWDAGSRAKLAMLRARGVVAVRYRASGCDVELEVLPNCIGSGTYDYLPYAAADTKILRKERDLFAELPLGAAQLGAQLSAGRALRTDYTLVGVAALPPGTTYPMSDLRGAGCERATHVVSRIYVGGFAMVAGEERAIEASARFFGTGAGARQQATAERIVTEGVAEACSRAQLDGKENAQCAVPLRVGLLPIVGRAPGGCPIGTTLEGKDCVQHQVVTQIDCPPGTSLSAGKCVGAVSRTCPSGTHFESGAGCVANANREKRPEAPHPRPPDPTHSKGDLVYYLRRNVSSGLLGDDEQLRAILERWGPAMRKCVLDQHLDDEWSMIISITFDPSGARGVGTRVLHRGVDARDTFAGDSLIDCGGLTALWPWPMPDPGLPAGEHAFVQLDAGLTHAP